MYCVVLLRICKDEKRCVFNFKKILFKLKLLRNTYIMYQDFSKALI